MHLFHQLNEEDQHNSVHYCMHMVVEDMLEDGVQVAPYSDEDKKIKTLLEKVIEDARKLPSDSQFEFVVTNKEVGPFIFDLALDMARSAYYHGDDELVIHHESLRNEEHVHDDDIEIMIQDVNNKVTKHNLN